MSAHDALANPFLPAGYVPSPADEAAASLPLAPVDAAANISASVDTATSAVGDATGHLTNPLRRDDPVAAPEPCGFYVSPPAFSDISDVGEIFYYARRLTGGDSRFDLYFNPAKFMADIEEPMPLFLRSR